MSEDKPTGQIVSFDVPEQAQAEQQPCQPMATLCCGALLTFTAIGQAVTCQSCGVNYICTAVSEQCEHAGFRNDYDGCQECVSCGLPLVSHYEQRIEELEDHYRGAREIIQGERLRREEAERVSLSAQAQLAELEGQVKRLREALVMNLPSDESDTAPEFLELLEETKPDGE